MSPDFTNISIFEIWIHFYVHNIPQYWEVVDARGVCTVGDANNIASVIKEAILDYGFSTDDFDEDNDKYTYALMDNINDVVLRMNEVARIS